MFTNTLSGETVFKIVVFAGDEARPRELLGAMGAALPRFGSVGEAPGGAGLVFDPRFDAAGVPGRYTFLAVDDPRAREHSLADADAALIVADSAGERDFLVKVLEQLAPALPCAIAAVADDAAAPHPATFHATLADPVGVFKTVVKALLTVRREGRLVEHNRSAGPS
ncbi:hypothetical protein [Nannocystis pusilla]|uniref:hypothetical protein n=1 Tax=Nannocystis pusilla TaxID=889268 RepID=UPI003BF267C5